MSNFLAKTTQGNQVLIGFLMTFGMLIPMIILETR